MTPVWAQRKACICCLSISVGKVKCKRSHCIKCDHNTNYQLPITKYVTASVSLLLFHSSLKCPWKPHFVKTTTLFYFIVISIWSLRLTLLDYSYLFRRVWLVLKACWVDLHRVWLINTACKVPHPSAAQDMKVTALWIQPPKFSRNSDSEASGSCWGRAYLNKPEWWGDIESNI